MSFIQRELDRVTSALREPCSAEVYDRLCTAQQALAWAIEPSVIAEPYATIMSKVANSVGCLSSSHQALS